MNGDGTPQSLHDVPKDWVPNPLGDATVIRSAIAGTLPDTDWSNPSWGLSAGPGFSFEFNIQSEGPVDAFTIHVRGSGDPLPAIVSLCRANGWVAFDYSTGELLDLSNPSNESWERFQAYRDRIVKR